MSELNVPDQSLDINILDKKAIWRYHLNNFVHQIIMKGGWLLAWYLFIKFMGDKITQVLLML